MVARAEALRKKKFSKENCQPTSLEEHRQNAEKLTMACDDQWVRERSPDAIVDCKTEKLTKTSFWDGLGIDGRFSGS